MKIDVFNKYESEELKRELAKCKILNDYNSLLRDKGHKCEIEETERGSLLLVTMGHLMLKYTLDLNFQGARFCFSPYTPESSFYVDIAKDLFNSILNDVLSNENVHKIVSGNKTIYYADNKNNIIVMTNGVLSGVFHTGDFHDLESIELDGNILNIKINDNFSASLRLKIDIETYSIDFTTEGVFARLFSPSSIGVFPSLETLSRRVLGNTRVQGIDWDKED